MNRRLRDTLVASVALFPVSQCLPAPLIGPDKSNAAWADTVTQETIQRKQHTQAEAAARVPFDCI